MFSGVFAWIVSHVPGFVRGAVNWLVEGLRRLTDVIAGKWNWLGVSAGRFRSGVLAYIQQLKRIAGEVYWTLRWVKDVWIPRRIEALRVALLAVINASIAVVRNSLTVLINTLRNWAQAAIANALRLIDALTRWARDQVARLTGLLDTLRRALAHVLGGPARLAEWLVTAMWRALYRFAYAQRDRIAQWVLRTTPGFTRWLAGTLEDLIVRWF